MGERGVSVDHSTLNRWVIKYGPDFEKAFRHRQGPVGRSGHLDKTYVKIKGKWAYLYRAVDKEGLTIDFLLTPDRDRDAAGALLRKAIRIRVVRTQRRLSTITRPTRRPSSSSATANI